MVIKIATFNVNSIRTRLEILSRWLESNPVDVLCLQETKAEDKDFPALQVRQMGYECVYSGEKSYNGVAILSKEKLENVSFGFRDGEENDFPTRVARAEYKGIKILNTYVPQGKEITHPDYQVKLAFLDRVKKFLDKHAGGAPFVWVGDVNVAPTEIDLTNPKTNKENVCFYLPLREKFASVTSGLVDIVRKFHPEPGIYSFFSYLTKDSLARNIGWRVDHILANENLAARAVGCEIDRTPRGWERPSDHVPVVAEFSYEEEN